MMLSEQNDDIREAWVLRAGAELWKAVIAEADTPAEDTQKALEAVRHALDCARRLRYAGKAEEQERSVLIAEAAHAADIQAMALQQWGNGRGLDWGTEWGTQWGEALSPGESTSYDPTNSTTGTQARLLKPFL